MANTITVDTKTINSILKQLYTLTQEVTLIKKTLREIEPAYGSKEWWKWSDKRAFEEIKAGKGTLISNKKELQGFLDSLKHEA